MKVVFLLFDSVNRLMLEPYGGTFLKTPNFTRLAEKSVTFDRHYIGSMPCMPARRDMQTGRHTFLHRSWGPLEPFDNSFAELLKTAGVYSHLISDHYHYWEDGGATYHTRYNSFEFIRGQESDPWKVLLTSPVERIREKYHWSQNDPDSKQNPYHYMINREFIKEEKDFPVGPVLRRRLPLPRYQSCGRQLVFAGRDFRSARAVLSRRRVTRQNSPPRTTVRFSIGRATNA